MRLLDQKGRPVVGATVTIAEDTFVTDTAGSFIAKTKGKPAAQVSFDIFTAEIPFTLSGNEVHLKWNKLVQINRPEDWDADFDSNPRIEFTPEGHVIIKGNANYNLITKQAFADFIASIEVVYTNSSHIFFRAVGTEDAFPKNAYSYWVHSDGKERVRNYHGAWDKFSFHVERDATVSFNEPIRIRLWAQGNEFSVTVNEQLWDEWEHDNGPTQGVFVFRKNYTNDTPLRITKVVVLEL